MIKLNGIKEIQNYFTLDKQGKEFEIHHKEVYGMTGGLGTRPKTTSGIFLDNVVYGNFNVKNNEIRTETVTKIEIILLMGDGNRKTIPCETLGGNWAYADSTSIEVEEVI